MMHSSATAAASTSTSTTRSGSSSSSSSLLLRAAAATLCAHVVGAAAQPPVAHMSNLARPSAPPRVPATADLCDEHEGSLQVADPTVAFKGFGAHGSFGGEIQTVKCFENNPLCVMALLSCLSRDVCVWEVGRMDALGPTAAIATNQPCHPN